MTQFHKPKPAILHGNRSQCALLLLLLLFVLLIVTSAGTYYYDESFLFLLAKEPTILPTLSPTTAESFVEGSSPYTPGNLEDGMMQISTSHLRYDVEYVDECDLFHNPHADATFIPLHDYIQGLDQYAKAVKEFQTPFKDLRNVPPLEQEVTCAAMDLLGKQQDNRNGRNYHFPTKSLSLTRGGYIEPLLPPMRHPKFCENLRNFDYLLDIDYLVHDFGAICQHLTKHPKARTVFFDLGASLEFHGGVKNPALTLLGVFERFGVTFDHYYAFEYTPLPPAQVYEKIPPSLLPSYHWYNVPVEADPAKKSNPWTLLSKFNEDDFVVVKLDVDTPHVEIPLIHQLLQEKYSKVVDHLYFEHHVRMKHMGFHWQKTAKGTIQDSLDLFTRLRKTGIAAHSWV